MNLLQRAMTNAVTVGPPAEGGPAVTGLSVLEQQFFMHVIAKKGLFIGTLTDLAEKSAFDQMPAGIVAAAIEAQIKNGWTDDFDKTLSLCKNYPEFLAVVPQAVERGFEASLGSNKKEFAKTCVGALRSMKQQTPAQIEDLSPEIIEKSLEIIGIADEEDRKENVAEIYRTLEGRRLLTKLSKAVVAKSFIRLLRQDSLEMRHNLERSAKIFEGIPEHLSEAAEAIAQFLVKETEPKTLEWYMSRFMEEFKDPSFYLRIKDACAKKGFFLFRYEELPADQRPPKEIADGVWNDNRSYYLNFKDYYLCLFLTGDKTVPAYVFSTLTDWGRPKFPGMHNPATFMDKAAGLFMFDGELFFNCVRPFVALFDTAINHPSTPKESQEILKKSFNSLAPFFEPSRTVFSSKDFSSQISQLYTPRL